jgi:serine phosphatase RsbU (regulator of sigma subunit)
MLYYKHGSRRLVAVNPSGMPLGVPMMLNGSFDERLEEINLSLGEGDLLFIYTDGVTEATDREGKQYGQARLVDFLSGRLRHNHHEPVSSLSEAIVSEIDSFSGFTKQSDDITFIIARTTGATTHGSDSPS